jgi:hypothetical protein
VVQSSDGRHLWPLTPIPEEFHGQQNYRAHMRAAARAAGVEAPEPGTSSRPRTPARGRLRLCRACRAWWRPSVASAGSVTLASACTWSARSPCTWGWAPARSLCAGRWQRHQRASWPGPVDGPDCADGWPGANAPASPDRLRQRRADRGQWPSPVLHPTACCASAPAGLLADRDFAWTPRSAGSIRFRSGTPSLDLRRSRGPGRPRSVMRF